MVIIKLDMSKKEELLNRIKLRKCLDEISEWNSVISCVDVKPKEAYIEKVHQLFKSDYPIRFKFPCNEFEVKEYVEKCISMNWILKEKYIIAYFNGSEFWIEVTVVGFEGFIKDIYDRGYFKNITLMDAENEQVLDIELGECDYEVRLFKEKQTITLPPLSF